MAQKVTVQLVDDLDDSPITAGEGRTVEFAFDGSTYEIDLSNDNVDKFREAISDYVAAARKVSGRRSSSGGGPGSARAGASRATTPSASTAGAERRHIGAIADPSNLSP